MKYTRSQVIRRGDRKGAPPAAEPSNRTPRALCRRFAARTRGWAGTSALSMLNSHKSLEKTMKNQSQDSELELNMEAIDAPEPEQEYSLEDIMREFGGWSKPAPEPEPTVSEVVPSSFCWP